MSDELTFVCESLRQRGRCMQGLCKMHKRLWQDLCTAVFHPSVCAEVKCSLSFHCMLLEPQAKRLVVGRCLTAKTLSYL